MLFQYKPYCQQDSLHLSEQDVAAVLEACFGKIPLSESVSNTNTATDSTTSNNVQNSGGGGGGGGEYNSSEGRRSSNVHVGGGAVFPWGISGGGGGGGSAQATSDVASVVLIKLIMDLYLLKGPRTAFSMVHFMLQRAVLYGDGAAKARVFDLILNLAVHGEMLYDVPGDQVPPEEDAAIAEAG